MNRTSVFASPLASCLCIMIPILGLSACGPLQSTGHDHEGHDHGASASAHADEHGDHDEHGQHDEEITDDHGHASKVSVALDDQQTTRLALETATAGPGAIRVEVELPGEVRINGDRMAHVAPNVGGIAREVLVSLGDQVKAGQVMARLDSRELADAKADCLAARERLRLAEAVFAREERLFEDKISSQQDYLDASNALAEARIAFRTAAQKLQALGIGRNAMERFLSEPAGNFTRYELIAPFSGEIIDRHITTGENVAAEETVFMIADLSSVWIDLQVYQKDLGKISAGQEAIVQPVDDGLEARATLEFVQPLLGESTRTALARITMANPDGRWKPGMFVTASVVVDEADVDLVAPRSAIIRMDDGDDVVFVASDHGFLPHFVTLGRRSRDHVEILSGIEAGEVYVAKGGFNLKAELTKDAFGDGHGH